MTYFKKYDYTIIRRHWILLILIYLRSFYYLFLAWLLLFISIKVPETLWQEILNYLLFPTIFFLVNYAFIKLILSYIIFYNDLLIVHNWQLIVLKTSLYLIDDIEFIDLNKITSIDTACRGIIQNIFWFWNLIVEQQREQVRKFHFVPEPNKALHVIKDEKERISK